MKDKQFFWVRNRMSWRLTAPCDIGFDSLAGRTVGKIRYSPTSNKYVWNQSLFVYHLSIDELKEVVDKLEELNKSL